MDDLLRVGRSTFLGGVGGGGTASTSSPSFLKIGSTCLPFIEPLPIGAILTDPAEDLRRWVAELTVLLIIMRNNKTLPLALPGRLRKAVMEIDPLPVWCALAGLFPREGSADINFKTHFRNNFKFNFPPTTATRLAPTSNFLSVYFVSQTKRFFTRWPHWGSTVFTSSVKSKCFSMLVLLLSIKSKCVSMLWPRRSSVCFASFVCSLLVLIQAKSFSARQPRRISIYFCFASLKATAPPGRSSVCFVFFCRSKQISFLGAMYLLELCLLSELEAERADTRLCPGEDDERLHIMLV